jgi:hypothetical protein
VRGKEKNHVEGAAAVKKLKRNVEKTTGIATKDRAARFEKHVHLNKDDKPLSVESMDVAKHGPNKGKSVCKLKRDRPFPRGPRKPGMALTSEGKKQVSSQ